MRRKKPLYRLTDGEKAIILRARREKNPNWVTNYYMRNADTGTYWRDVHSEDVARLLLPEFVECAQRWKAGYDNLSEIWHQLGEPQYFYPDNGDWNTCSALDYEVRADRLERVYRAFEDIDTGEIVFHHPHGALLLDWQLQFFQAPQFVDVVIGGFGSGKTWAKILHMMTRAIMLKGYRGFVLAPYSIQSMEVFTQALTILTDTLYEERFLLRSPTKPFPKLVIGHDGVGENTIEFFPILDDPNKIRTLTGDEGMVDQVEQLPDINELVRNLGTRLRGQHKGRPRVGKISLIGNPGDNPEMWDWFDDAETAPDEVWAHTSATHQNLYLTVADLLRLQKQVGDDDESQAMYLFGARPRGSGKHFPAASIERCHSEDLDDIMKYGLAQGTPGFKLLKRPKVAEYRWELPYIEDHEYLVTADPGWGNPPYRNSAVVGVWDITSFVLGGPAILSAFSWVYGNGSPNPWIQQYVDYVLDYHAVGRNAYDATGFQATYQSLSSESFDGLLSEPLPMPGQKKFSALNLAKKMWADGRFAVPKITHLFSQLAKYDLPDNKLRQDIVSFILVTAQWLERLYYIDAEAVEEETDYDPEDRYGRIDPDARYPGRT